jgi:hypothetical protein
LSIVVAVNFDARWKRPIHVGEEDELTQTVTGPSAAISYMRTGFRHRSGRSFNSAWETCHDALLGTASLTQARNKFLAAYTEDCVRTLWDVPDERFADR